MPIQTSALVLPDTAGSGFGRLISFSVTAARASRRIALSMAVVGVAVMAPLAWAGFADGGFELGTGTAFSSSWTVNSYTIPAAIATFPPQKKADIFNTTSTDPTPLVTPNGLTSVVSSGTDAGSGGALHYPVFGNKAALVNLGGTHNRSSSIYQRASMSFSDIDPADGKIHIRFAIAPVLEDASHKPEEQPYFFIEIRNLTKGTQLFHSFNFSGQAGVPWQYAGGYAYTDWQTLDVAPGSGFLDVGDQVSLEVMASGCGLGGHEGHVYVDGVGAFISGLMVTVSGPTVALPGTDISYTYTYSNSSGAAVTNPTVSAQTPQDGTVGGAPNYLPAPLDATFVSYNAPGGVCTAPAVGSAGIDRCDTGLDPDLVEVHAASALRSVGLGCCHRPAWVGERMKRNRPGDNVSNSPCAASS